MSNKGSDLVHAVRTYNSATFCHKLASHLEPQCKPSWSWLIHHSLTCCLSWTVTSAEINQTPEGQMRFICYQQPHDCAGVAIGDKWPLVIPLLRLLVCNPHPDTELFCLIIFIPGAVCLTPLSGNHKTLAPCPETGCLSPLSFAWNTLALGATSSGHDALHVAGSIHKGLWNWMKALTFRFQLDLSASPDPTSSSSSSQPLPPVGRKPLPPIGSHSQLSRGLIRKSPHSCHLHFDSHQEQSQVQGKEHNRAGVKNLLLS